MEITFFLSVHPQVISDVGDGSFAWPIHIMKSQEMFITL